MESNGQSVTGGGRITLLQLIHETGSISEAARIMKMSYRQAWEQIQHMNSNFPFPLVIKSSGGKGGGGTIVTKEGLRLIESFQELQAKFAHYCEAETKEWNTTFYQALCLKK